ncbi:hypothetical protein KXV85_000497, partial [Aspergillus fumigatus]
MSAQRSNLVCGGAFDGLALALALRQGLGPDVPVVVADPALPQRPSRDPRATAIVAACRRLFEALGVWDQVAPNAQAILDMVVTDSQLTDATRPVFLTFGGEVEQAYDAARSSTGARAVLTAIIIFIVFSSVVAILWVGSHDVLIGEISPGRLGQFVLYAAFAAAGLGQLSEVWGEVSAASGAAERLFEILRVQPEIAAPASPRALPSPPRGDVAFDNVSFSYPARPGVPVVDGVSFS